MNIFRKVTSNTLKEAKVRTIVTIVGIALSACLFTAATTFLGSITSFAEQVDIKEGGNYYIKVKDKDNKIYNEINNDSSVENISRIDTIGYAEIKNNNEGKPYLYVASVNDSFVDYMNVKLTDGRLPSNDSEIILPNHLFKYGGEKTPINNIINLEVGNRQYSGDTTGNILDQYVPYNVESPEVITSTVNKAYKVVGYYERPLSSVENFEAPGYTALTVDKNSTGDKGGALFIKLKKSFKIDAEGFLDKYNIDKGENTAEINWSLLAFSGTFQYNNFLQQFLIYCSVFFIIIIVASIVLIASAFSISVSERTKQFGLLSSIGATKKQIRRTVFYEAMSVSIVGIPLGILIGIIGMGTTVTLLSDEIMQTMNIDSGASLKYVVSPLPIIFSVLLTSITIFISVLIPSIRATRISAIEAIRQSKDIKVKGRKVRVSKFTRKFFGTEGILATKYFKVSKRKYRTTVISLAMSMVLFIVTCAFAKYLNKSVNMTLEKLSYDVSIYNYGNKDENYSNIDFENNYNKAVNGIKTLPGIEGLSVVSGDTGDNYEQMIISKDMLTNDALKSQMENYEYKSVDEINNLNTYMITTVYLDDDSYNRLIEQEGLDKGKYIGVKNPPAILFNRIHKTDYFEGDRKVYEYDNLRKDVNKIVIIDEQANTEYIKKYGDNYQYNGIVYEKTDLSKGEFYAEYAQYKDNGDIVDSSKVVDKLLIKEVEIGDMISTCPMGLDNSKESNILIYPKSAQKVMGWYQVNIKTDNYEEMMPKLKDLIKENGMDDDDIYDAINNNRKTENMLFVVEVFIYGFITLITLTSVANVFNTISTNIALRKRDFAMIKSIGMTNKSVNKMMIFECLIYGLKAILFGLPVSLVLVFFFSRQLEVPHLHDDSASTFSNVITYINETFPVGAIILAIVIIFIVVFISMFYAISKIKKDNIIETLKNENV